MRLMKKQVNDSERREWYKRKYDWDCFNEHFDSPTPPATTPA